MRSNCTPLAILGILACVDMRVGISRVAVLVALCVAVRVAVCVAIRSTLSVVHHVSVVCLDVRLNILGTTSSIK